MYRQLRQFRQFQRLKQQLQQTAHYSASPLAGRTYIAGAEAKTFPKFLPSAHHDFPFVFKAKNVKRGDLEHFAVNFRPILDSLIREHGIVMIRGSEMYTAEDFATFFHSLNYKVMRNIPGLGETRHEVGRNVYSGRSDPKEVNIEPHHEHSYLDKYPELFLVHCEDPVDEDCGGDYIIANTKEVQRHIDPSVLEKFRTLGVRYHKQLPCIDTPHQSSWQKVMQTMNHCVVERRLKQHGFEFVWDDNGSIHFWIDRPAFTNHYRTGEKLWFNQITTQHWTFHSNHPRYENMELQSLPKFQFPSNTFYGDGSEIDIGVIQHIREVMWDNAVGFQFKRGDLLIMDNMLIQHGRLAWSGERQISIGHAMHENFH